MIQQTINTNKGQIHSMRHRNNHSVTKLITYSCTAYLILTLLLYTIFYFQYRETIHLSSFGAIFLAQLLPTALLISGMIYLFKKRIKSHFISPGEIQPNITQIFNRFNRNDSSIRENHEIKEYLADSKNKAVYSILLDEMESLHSAENKIIEKINAYEGLYSKLQSDMQPVAGKSDQLTDNSQSFYKNAFSQAAELEEISRSMGQFVFQISDIADHTNTANQLAMETQEVTKNGMEQMDDLISAISAISDSSRKILDMIKTIDQIAAQTKLLALNATIEANRAGEHGRAFAVVAQEVRNLSIHSTNAAQETSKLVDTAMDHLEYGNEISSTTVQVLTRMEEEVQKVSKIIEEIAESSTLQAESVNRFDESLKEINQLTRQQKNVAKEATSVSHELSRYVKQLTKNLDSFQDQDGWEARKTIEEKKNRIRSKQIERPLKFIFDFDPPLTYMENGKARGILTDIVVEIFSKRMGLDVDHEQETWSLCNKKVRKGLSDAFFTFPTDERLKFCDTHIRTGYTFEWTIFTYAGHPRMDDIKKIRSFDDIIKGDFTIGTYLDNGWAKMMLEDKGVKVKYFKNEFKALAAKEMDFLVEDPQVGRHKIKLYRITEGKLMEVPVVLQTDSYMLLIHKNSPYVHALPEFDRHLQEMKKDGTMEQILLRYQ